MANTTQHIPSPGLKAILAAKGLSVYTEGFAVDTAEYGKFLEEAARLHPELGQQQKADWAAYNALMAARGRSGNAATSSSSEKVRKPWAGAVWKTLWRIAVLAALLVIAHGTAKCQGTSQIDVIQFQDSGGAPIKSYASPFKFRCGSGLTCTAVAGNIINVTPSQVIGPIRQKLSDSAIYYVRTDGNDSNDGSANDPSHAFRTINSAYGTLVQNIDAGGQEITIQVADGIYTSATYLSDLVGTTSVIIQGNDSNPENCLIHTSDAAFSFNTAQTSIYISGFKLQTDGGDGLWAEGSSSVTVGTVDFGDMPGAHVLATAQANVFLSSNYTISSTGTSGSHIRAEDSAIVLVSGAAVVTLSGNPHYGNAFAVATNGGRVSFYNSFSGAATGKRFQVGYNSRITTPDPDLTWLPGDVAGELVYDGSYNDTVNLISSVAADAPLAGSGTASSHLSIPSATSLVDGYLSHGDWSTFNGKSSVTLPIAESDVTNLSTDLNGKQAQSSNLDSWSALATSAKQDTLTLGNLTASGPLSFDNTRQVVGGAAAVSITEADTSHDGYLSQTDWNTFNGKQASGSYLTGVAADAPLSGSGTSGSHLVISQAATGANGYLSSTDWNTFNGKQAAGSYALQSTTISTTAPLAGGGDLSTNRTFSIPVATDSVDGYLSKEDHAVKIQNGTPTLDNGNVTTTFLAGENISAYALIYMASDSKWYNAKADAASTSGGLVGMAVETKTTGNAIAVALPGTFITNSSWSWTPGAILYISASNSGVVTASQPAAANNVIRVVGFAVTATSIYYNPAGLYFTHV